MAIRVIDTIQTSAGNTNTLHMVIVAVNVDKKDGSQVTVHVDYFTDDTKTTACSILETGGLKEVYILNLSSTIHNDNNPFKLAYDQISADMLSAGLTPQSDESGSWVTYTVEIV